MSAAELIDKPLFIPEKCFEPFGTFKGLDIALKTHKGRGINRSEHRKDVFNKLLHMNNKDFTLLSYTFDPSQPE